MATVKWALVIIQDEHADEAHDQLLERDMHTNQLDGFGFSQVAIIHIQDEHADEDVKRSIRLWTTDQKS